MDVVSYLLGKNASGGGGGGGISDYITDTLSNGSSGEAGVIESIKKLPSFTATGSSLAYAFFGFKNVESIEGIDSTNVSAFSNMFTGCNNLLSVPLFDMSKATYANNMFSNCKKLATVPQFNLSNLYSMANGFANCFALTDESLNNILASLAGAVNYSGTKTLAGLGLTSTYYPASRIQALSNYQDFVAAGWSIGY